MRIILISGPYGSGKDTFGNFIKNCNWDCGHQRIIHINFADWVKDAAKRYFLWDGNKTTEDGRHFLQYFATDLVRTNDPTYWAEVVVRLCKAIEKEFDLVIVTDLRFPNEYTTFTKFFPIENIITIRLDRSMPDADTRQHESENSLKDFIFDYYIDNNGSLDDLKYCAEKIFRSIQ